VARPKLFRRKSEIARDLGVTKGRISQLLKVGLPMRRDGMIDRDVAFAWYAEHVRPRVKPVARTGDGIRQRASAAASPAPSAKAAQIGDIDHAGNDDATTDADGAEYLRSRTRHETARANRAELDLLVQQGRLVDVEEICKWWAIIATAVRDEVMAIPSRIVNRLPEEWRRQVNALAQEETRSVLTAISHKFSQPAVGPESGISAA